MRSQDPEVVHVREEGRLLSPGELVPSEAELRRAGRDLVLEVRDVHHMARRNVLLAQVTSDQVEVEVRPSVADVGFDRYTVGPQTYMWMGPPCAGWIGSTRPVNESRRRSPI